MKVSGKILVLGKIFGSFVMIYSLFFLFYSLHVVYGFNAALCASPLVSIWAVLLHQLFWKKTRGRIRNKGKADSEQLVGLPKKIHDEPNIALLRSKYPDIENIRTEICKFEHNIRIMAIAGTMVAWLYEDFKNALKKQREMRILLLNPDFVKDYKQFFAYERERQSYKEFIVGPFRKIVSTQFKEKISEEKQRGSSIMPVSIIKTSEKLWNMMKEEVERETNTKVRNFEVRYMDTPVPLFKGIIFDDKKAFIGDYSAHGGTDPLTPVNEESRVQRRVIQFDVLWDSIRRVGKIEGD